jgi:hypothetical protein
VTDPGTKLTHTAILIALACCILAGCKSETEAPPAAPSTFRDAEIARQCTNSHIVLRNTAPQVSEVEVWCWAASGKMAMDAIEPSGDHRQCLQAIILFGSVNCCKGIKPLKCRDGGVPPLKRFSFDSQTSARALTTEEVVNELCVGKRPFLAVWPIGGGGSHMTAVVDYDTTGDEMIIDDPWAAGQMAGQWAVPYTEYFNEHGTKNSDIYNIKKMTP